MKGVRWDLSVSAPQGSEVWMYCDRDPPRVALKYAMEAADNAREQYWQGSLFGRTHVGRIRRYRFGSASSAANNPTTVP